MLAGLLAVPLVWAATGTLAGGRHCIASPRLQARRNGEASGWYGPDLGPLVAPEREAPAHPTRYTAVDQGLPPRSGPQGACDTAGAFLHPRPSLAARPGG